METNVMVWGCLLFASTLSISPALNAATTIVTMREFGTNYIFDPAALTLNPGDTVKWTNTSLHAHDSTHSTVSGPRLWASPLLSGTSTFSFTFNSPGYYPYICQTHFIRNHPEETGAVTVVSLNLPPAVEIIHPTNGTIVFGPATFIVQATASDSDGTVAQVEFFRGAALLGTTTNSPYTNVVTALPPGTYGFTAIATDNLGAKATSSVVNVIVATNLPPLVEITSPTNGTIVFGPATFALHATAADSDGTVAQVEFFRDASFLATATNSPYSIVVTALPPGTYAFTAIATDNQEGKTTSSVVNVTVTAPPTIRLVARRLFLDGSLEFGIEGGSPGQTCIVEGCDILPNWASILTNIIPITAGLEFTASATNLNGRFYRCRILP